MFGVPRVSEPILAGVKTLAVGLAKWSAIFGNTAKADFAGWLDDLFDPWVNTERWAISF